LAESGRVNIQTPADPAVCTLADMAMYPTSDLPGASDDGVLNCRDPRCVVCWLWPHTSQGLPGRLIGTDPGSRFVIKAPGAEIEGLRGPLPVLFRHELYRHSAAPVVRLMLRLYDRPPTSLAFESFVNVDDTDWLRRTA
jgi:hypothetical protein